jgi:hypothetical protein
MINQTTIFINLLITFGSLITIYGSVKNINMLYNFIYHFYNFLHENNPLIIDYSEYYNKDKKEGKDEKKEIDNGILKKHETIYEDKYLEKFKKFPNEFNFSDLELELEKKHFDLMKSNMENNLLNNKNNIKEKLLKIKEIYENGGIEHNNEFYTENINDFGKESLCSFFDLDEEDDLDFEELFMDLKTEKLKLEEEIKKLDNIIITEDELKKNAREFIINKKLDTYKENYILECTPLGNIYMRYNNDKKSFEYFSNNTIPYRYLEPVGRKYVMTYWCKPIFVDIEDEIKKFEEKQKIVEQKKNEEEPKIKSKEMAKFKNYNKETINSSSMRQPQKNRNSTNIVLPPHIMANVQNINSNNEKKFLKENANRYTWEGRLNSFSPLKKIDLKIVNKNLSLSFAEFKKMQKNKK